MLTIKFNLRLVKCMCVWFYLIYKCHIYIDICLFKIVSKSCHRSQITKWLKRCCIRICMSSIQWITFKSLTPLRNTKYGIRFNYKLKWYFCCCFIFTSFRVVLFSRSVHKINEFSSNSIDWLDYVRNLTNLLHTTTDTAFHKSISLNNTSDHTNGKINFDRKHGQHCTILTLQLVMQWEFC